MRPETLHRDRVGCLPACGAESLSAQQHPGLLSSRKKHAAPTAPACSGRLLLALPGHARLHLVRLVPGGRSQVGAVTVLLAAAAAQLGAGAHSSAAVCILGSACILGALRQTSDLILLCPPQRARAAARPSRAPVPAVQPRTSRRCSAQAAAMLLRCAPRTADSTTSPTPPQNRWPRRIQSCPGVLATSLCRLGDASSSYCCGSCLHRLQRHLRSCPDRHVCTANAATGLTVQLRAHECTRQQTLSPQKQKQSAAPAADTVATWCTALAVYHNGGGCLSCMRRAPHACPPATAGERICAAGQAGTSAQPCRVDPDTASWCCSVIPLLDGGNLHPVPRCGMRLALGMRPRVGPMGRPYG